MLIADDQRRWTTGNTAASELLGIPAEEIPWRKMDEFTPLSERQKLDQLWEEFLASGTAEGWYRLSIPNRGSLAVEFSATANVLPARHLTVFIPPDNGSSEQAESELAARGWIPVVAGSGRRPLTEREREVMTMVASGLHTDDVAAALVLSPETIKSHVQNALAKLGAHTRAHAVAIAMVTGEIAWDF